MTQQSENPQISFVVPAYNEAEGLSIVTERIIEVARTQGLSFEIILINDGSVDGTGDVIDMLSGRHACVVPLHFSRNFGHMAALTAGFEAARGTDAVICLDSDGQHPPELIPEMIRLWKAGADIVQTIRESGEDEGLLKRSTSRLFYQIFNLLSDTEIPEGAADFRLLDRQVVNALNTLPENVRFVRGLVHWVGFHCEHLPYTAEQRFSGSTSYTLFSMLRLAFDGITSFSVRPLRLSYLMAFLVVLATMAYGGYVLICYAVGKPLEAGWSSLMMTVLILGAVQLLVIGIASEYLARLYTEQKQRPVYILRKQKGHRKSEERRPE